jgi:hypothetical protein
MRSVTVWLFACAAWVLAGSWCLAVIQSVMAGHHSTDARTYHDVWSSDSLYDLPPNTIGAYLYSPAFAQLIWPLTRLPMNTFVWVWFAIGLAAYVWLVAPAGPRFGVPLLALGAEDLRLGQITWLMAVACVVGLRRPGAFAAVFLTKILPSVGLLYDVARRSWSAPLAALKWTGAVMLVSALAAPRLWVEWLRFLADSANSSGTALPRMVVALLVVLLAARVRQAWMVAIGMMMAMPVGGLHVVGMVCALPRLLKWSRVERSA